MINNISIPYTRYTKAFCQVGRPSTLATACWMKSKKKQQNGASNVMMNRPAQICQIPATMHKGDKEMQHQNPKKTAATTMEKLNGFVNKFLTLMIFI